MKKEEFISLTAEERDQFIRKTDPKLLAEMDGHVFINMDIAAKTELGRFLAPFTKANFNHPHYGPFSSTETFWNWLCSGDSVSTRNNDLRPLYGQEAKTKGRKNKWTRINNFYGEIVFANYIKIKSNRDMFRAMIESDSPFVMYFTTPDKSHAIPVAKRQWLLLGMEEIRKHLREKGLSIPYIVSQEIIRMK